MILQCDLRVRCERSSCYLGCSLAPTYRNRKDIKFYMQSQLHTHNSFYVSCLRGQQPPSSSAGYVTTLLGTQDWCKSSPQPLPPGLHWRPGTFCQYKSSAGIPQPPSLCYDFCPLPIQGQAVEEVGVTEQGWTGKHGTGKAWNTGGRTLNGSRGMLPDWCER